MAIDIDKLALITARIEYLNQQVNMHEGFVALFGTELERALKEKENILTGEDNVQR